MKHKVAINTIEKGLWYTFLLILSKVQTVKPEIHLSIPLLDSCKTPNYSLVINHSYSFLQFLFTFCKKKTSTAFESDGTKAITCSIHTSH